MDLSRLFLSTTFIVFCLSVSAQMALSNTSTVLSEEVSVLTDITAPRTDLLRTEAGDFIYGPATRIKFKIVEDESGHASTYFKVADHPFMKSDGRQMMPHDLADGSYKMKYYSTDNEGNQEPIREESIYLDKQGPIIRSGFNNSPVAFDKGLPVFPRDINLAIDVNDAIVAVQKVTVSINGNENLEFRDSEHIDLTEHIRTIDEEKIIVEVRAYDTFYNLSKEIIEFKRTR